MDYNLKNRDANIGDICINLSSNFYNYLKVVVTEISTCVKRTKQTI